MFSIESGGVVVTPDDVFNRIVDVVEVVDVLDRQVRHDFTARNPRRAFEKLPSQRSWGGIQDQAYDRRYLGSNPDSPSPTL
jgi:hypothetical protein